MKSRHTRIAFACFILCHLSGVAGAQTSELALQVAQFYPQSLIDLSAEVGRELHREQCFAVLETDPSGAPKTVVAAYTDLSIGEIRVLTATSGGLVVVAAASPSELHMGQHCEIEAVDVDNDGRLEAHVQFLARNSSMDWIYAWDGQQLINLTPVMPDTLSGMLETDLINVDLLDLNGDNVLEVYSFSVPPREGTVLPSRLYSLSGGRYQFDRDVVGLYTFERSTGAPETETAIVIRPQSAIGPFRLRVINGAGVSGPKQRVENAIESGRVWLNGVEIIRPNDFGNQVAIIDRTVTLNEEDDLEVRLAGAPGRRIAIVIDPASWAP